MLSNSTQLETAAERLPDERLPRKWPEPGPLWLMSWWTAMVTFGVTTWVALTALLF